VHARITPRLPRLVALFWCATAAHLVIAATPRPNILFMLADDLGWSDLSCYGSSFQETPQIDRLAREGMRFTQAYSAGSICSPTRASLMTGKYPVRTGVTDYIPGLSSEGRKLSARPTKTELALEEVTVGEAFREAGYETFYAGKWHLGGKGFEPSEQGFEHYVSDEELGDHGRDWQVGKRIAQAAIDFLGQRDQRRPFLAYLGFHEPHTPTLEYPNHIERFRRKAAQLPATKAVGAEHEGKLRLRQDNPAYGSEVAGLDEFVGNVLAALDARGLRENTIVVFISDNGGLSVRNEPGPTSNAPLRAGKGWLYEGGIRVPLIVRAPGVTRAGTVAATPVITTDVYPTLLTLAGLPLRPAQHLDGTSFVPVLRGETPTAARTLYWHYPHYHGSTWAPGAALREGNWKLVENLHYESVELFDLSQDLSEKHDLAKTKPEVTTELLGKLHAWQKSVGAFIPKPATQGAAAEQPKKKKNRKASANP
jgi:arylsulfatase A-like enzyme